jgi:hypothetical protein
MAIYSKKYGKKLLNESIRIDGDCYFGDQVFKIRAVIEGRTKQRVFYITDLLAEDGKAEINDVLMAARRKDEGRCEISATTVAPGASRRSA